MGRKFIPQSIRDVVDEARQRQRSLAIILDYLTEVTEREWTEPHRQAVSRAEIELEIIESAVRMALGRWDRDETEATEAARAIRETLHVARLLCGVGAQEATILRELFQAWVPPRDR